MVVFSLWVSLAHTHIHTQPLYNNIKAYQAFIGIYKYISIFAFWYSVLKRLIF